MSKEYGLIMPGKNKMIIQAPGRRAAIFDEESDSDEPLSVKPTFVKPLEKKKTKLAQDKAIEEDPTVFQYDEIYDDMEKKRKESKLSNKNLEKKPKYISNLLKTAERRKRENERRIERQVQKEREAEGDEFKDKESYVTPSYQKKLDEMKSLEEKEKREEYLESIGDVRKQGNLDGFYRHLYEQKMNYEDKIQEESNDKSNIGKNKNMERTTSEGEDKSDDKNMNKKAKKRHYRTREDSESDEDQVEESKKEHIPSNLDADSDFSIDSSDSGDEDVRKNKETRCETSLQVFEDMKVEGNKDGIEKKAVDIVLEEPGKCEPKEVDIEEQPIEIAEPTIKKPKIDIWKKRTVGEIFEAARKRYFERLSFRESG